MPPTDPLIYRFYELVMINGPAWKALIEEEYGDGILRALLARQPTKVPAIALANKIARMAWAMMAKGERYKEPIALAA